MMPDKALPIPPGDTRKRAYTKLVRAVCAALAALYEFVTSEPAPKMRDVLNGD